MRALLEKLGLASPLARILRRPSRPQAPVSGLADGGTYRRNKRVAEDGRVTLARVCHLEPWTQALSSQGVDEPLDLPDPTYPSRFRATSLERRGEDRQERLARWCASETARMAPWVRCYVGPQLEGEDESPYWGRAHYCMAGQAGQGDTIVVRSDMREDDVRRTYWHEVWHILERFLTKEAMAAVNEALVRQGGEWGGASKVLSDPRKQFPNAGEFEGEYMSSDVERRARLFGLWCALIDEGGGAVIPGDLAPQRGTYGTGARSSSPRGPGSLASTSSRRGSSAGRPDVMDV
ncbi:hypothetical protein CR162_21220 [Pseudoroseomonas rhizosphaerae]|uniref:Uncharacterized protein n=1 Tax=Teichococcus rhizosphaerae TaxID=1335062 RepID=A0A2C7A6L0_9PROT|nr:hypothetical protein [Pseudoroseomonas rhizosphaerae]PHK92955.1 hypothetical protein CR162_21220 [Pseudoroseomonas rhizosphaerae]